MEVAILVWFSDGCALFAPKPSRHRGSRTLASRGDVMGTTPSCGFLFRCSETRYLTRRRDAEQAVRGRLGHPPLQHQQVLSPSALVYTKSEKGDEPCGRVQRGFFAGHVMHLSAVRPKDRMNEMGKALQARAGKMISFGRR